MSLGTLVRLPAGFGSSTCGAGAVAVAHTAGAAELGPSPYVEVVLDVRQPPLCWSPSRPLLSGSSGLPHAKPLQEGAPELLSRSLKTTPTSALRAVEILRDLLVAVLARALDTPQLLLNAAPDQRLDLADVLFLLDAPDRFDDPHEIARQGNEVAIGTLLPGGAR